MSCGCPDFLAASRGESLLMFIRLRSPSCCRQQLKQSALPRSAAQCAGVLPSSVTKQQESKGKDGDSARVNIIFCLLLSLAKLKLSFNLEPFLTSKRDWCLVNISKLDWGHLFIINCLLNQKKNIKNLTVLSIGISSLFQQPMESIGCSILCSLQIEFWFCFDFVSFWCLKYHWNKLIKERKWIKK